MPQATTIILNDGQVTPVAHSFAPSEIDTGKAVFRDAGTAVTFAGRPQLILSYSNSKPERPTVREDFRVNYPVESTVDGVTSVAYTARAEIKLTIPEQMTSAQRDDFAAFVTNLLAHATVQGYMKDLEPVWG